MEITDLLGLILEMSIQFRRNILGVTRRYAKRISYSEIGFASGILHHIFTLHGL